MHKKCLLLLLLLCHTSSGYENERAIKIKSDSHPLRISYYNRHSQPVKLKLKTNQKFKRQNDDSVRGEMIPQSRRDIMNIKKVSFHGRKVNSDGNSTVKPHYLLHNTSHLDVHKQPKASQRKDIYQQSHHKKVQKKERESNSVEESPPYIPDDTPFYPLMKPSPINVMPMKQPSFDTVRSYVQYLKMRQHKFFSDFDDDNQPVPEVSSQHRLEPYDGEIDYFKEREQELAREEGLRNQFSPANYGKSSDEQEQPFDTNGSNESETVGDDENAVIHQRTDDSNNNHDDDVISSNEQSSYYDYADNGDDESRKTESFVPFRLYAQVRHVESENHEKPKKSKVREKVSLAKKNIYYKEEGYEDKNYDHGAEKIDYDLNEKRNGKKRNRSKRSTDEKLNVSELPVALAYIKKSELPQLTGEKLFSHLDELIKNSSKYMDDDDDASRPVHFKAIKPSSKYPYYNFPEKILSEMSAHRYSENLRNYPKHRQSFYEHKNAHPCEEIEDDIDPVPKDIEVKGKRGKFNNSPKRLNNLGDKIQCFREKYFGKDPFDNPLFKEDEYVEATIPIPVNHNLSRQVNPLITVYDDVIHNIRSGMVNEFKKKREADDVIKQASEQIAIKAKSFIPNYSSVSGVAQLSMFDINTFLPKYRGSIGKYSSEEQDTTTEVPTTTVTVKNSRKRKRNNLLLEDQNLDPPVQQVKFTTVEVPKSKSKKKHKPSQLNTLPETPPKPISTSIKNFHQPTPLVKSPSNTKYRRYVIPTKHITTITQQLPPPSSGKTTYRFKLL